MATEQETKKSKSIRNWIIACVGAIILIVGGIGLIQNESVNLVLIEAGASQMSAGIVEEQPKAGPVIIQVADVLDAAVQARTTSPKELAQLVNSLVDKGGFKFDTSHIVNAVIGQINSARQVSKTEEEYITRLECLIRGLRSGVAAAGVEAAEDNPLILQGDTDKETPCL